MLDKSKLDETFLATQYLHMVLRHVPKRNLLLGKPHVYRIALSVYQDDMAHAWFYVDADDVHEVRTKTGTSWNVVLSQKEYRLYCEYTDGQMKSELIHRYLLYDAYVTQYPQEQMYDLMAVPMSAIVLGEHDWADFVSFMSATVRPGAFLNFRVDKKSVHWVVTKDVSNMYQLLSMAHIDLCDAYYDVIYKDSATQWKDVKVSVSREDLIADLRIGNRASVSGISVKRYHAWYAQEHALFSYLFS